MSDRDTIFALSSGRPPAAIAVLRVSGPRAGPGLEALVRRMPQPRRATLAKLRDPASGEVLDQALVLWLPGPGSETGEDMAELQIHGGRAVIAAVLDALGRLDGFRPAGPGEFIRRAFENGRVDLTGVEAVGDLVFAETQAQRRQALRQIEGALAGPVEDWRRRLIDTQALVEASIDFSDEGDVPKDLLADALEKARSLHDEIVRALADDRRGERLRDGIVVAIAGPPNAGKSSVLNRIARREAAIVSPFAGTTRDVIEVHLDLDGYPLTLLDTAGIRDTEDPIEREGVRRARERAEAADLVLWVVDATQPMQVANAGAPTPNGDRPAPCWIIRNKIDLIDSSIRRNEPRFTSVFAVSALRGDGLDGLLGALAAFAASFLEGPEPAVVTRQRHRAALTQAARALERAGCEHVAGREDLLAEELRLAARALGRITGRVDVEDILDVIFRDFCIGK